MDTLIKDSPYPLREGELLVPVRGCLTLDASGTLAYPVIADEPSAVVANVSKRWESVLQRSEALPTTWACLCGRAVRTPGDSPLPPQGGGQRWRRHRGGQRISPFKGG